MKIAIGSIVPEEYTKAEMAGYLPYPYSHNSVDQIYCEDFIQYLPRTHKEYIDEFFIFFNECWRILKPNGTMILIVPNARSNKAFINPAACRFYVGQTFDCLSKTNRVSNKQDSLAITADFIVTVSSVLVEEMKLFHKEAADRRQCELWNTVSDWRVVLVKIPEGDKPLGNGATFTS